MLCGYLVIHVESVSDDFAPGQIVFRMTTESLLLFSAQLFGLLDFKSEKIVNDVLKERCASLVPKGKFSSFYDEGGPLGLNM